MNTWIRKRAIALARLGPDEVAAQYDGAASEDPHCEVDPNLTEAVAPSIAEVLNRLFERYRETLPRAAIDELRESGAASEEDVERQLDTLLAGWLDRDSAAFVMALAAALAAAALAGYRAALQPWLDHFGVEGVPALDAPEEILEWAAQRAADLLHEIKEEIRGKIKRIIVEGRSAGRSKEETIRRIRKTLEDSDIAGTRARDEAHRAVHHGALNLHKALAAARKEWITRHDERVCRQCRVNEAAGPIPLSERFPTGHEYPPAHKYCRCRLWFSGVSHDGLFRFLVRLFRKARDSQVLRITSE